MVWKSTTFNRWDASGRVVPRGGIALHDTAPSGGKPEGIKAPGAKPKRWSVIKAADAVPPKPADDARAASSQAVAKHRDAMTGVIREAKKIAEERRETLASINDPELKRSAAR